MAAKKRFERVLLKVPLYLSLILISFCFLYGQFIPKQVDSLYAAGQTLTCNDI